MVIFERGKRGLVSLGRDPRHLGPGREYCMECGGRTLNFFRTLT